MEQGAEPRLGEMARRQSGEQSASEGNSMRHGAGGGGKQLAADGGVVRTMPIRTPQRIARWMPRRVRAAVVAQYAAQEASGEEGETERPRDEETKGLKDESSRPRQLAVPYQNYRRYRG